MTTERIAISACGMVTGVGLNADSTGAAIRANIDNFQQTRFRDTLGNWINGSQVEPLIRITGTSRWIRLLCDSVEDCLSRIHSVPNDIPIILVLPERDRPGRLSDIKQKLTDALSSMLDRQLHETIQFVEYGRVGGMVALNMARDMIQGQRTEHVLVASVDSLLTPAAIRHYLNTNRLCTESNSDGLIPGEAGAALIVSRFYPAQKRQCVIEGLGFDREQVTVDSEEPLRGEGLARTIKAALADAGKTVDDTQFRLAHASGEQYWFKEGTLALAKLLRTTPDDYPIWHISDCVGELGASTVFVSLGYASYANDNAMLSGQRMIHHVSNDDVKRGAAIVRFS